MTPIPLLSDVWVSTYAAAALVPDDCGSMACFVDAGVGPAEREHLGRRFGPAPRPREFDPASEASLLDLFSRVCRRFLDPHLEGGGGTLVVCRDQAGVLALARAFLVNAMGSPGLTRYLVDHPRSARVDAHLQGLPPQGVS